MQKRYPFKFLNSYTRADRDIFFGRKEEIDTLYQMVFQTDIILIHGASGTGKTSLIQCGLASRFESHDWLALNIRRGNNLNTSFENSLIEAGGIVEEPDTALDWLEQDLSTEEVPNTTNTPKQSTPMARSLRAIYLKHFKPIYLIFDQFEELYILGNKTEQNNFIAKVKEVLQVEQPVKIIISIREEYLGHLYEFEKKVPQLLRKKLRVEPMNLDKVKQVVVGIGKNSQTNVQLKKGEEEKIGELIFEKIKGKANKLSIPLPYLQVFFDKLYMSITKDEERKVDAVFSKEAVKEMKDIDNILRDFLDEQVQDTAKELQVKPDLIWKILSPFVTLDGTKEPLTFEQLQRRFSTLDRNFLTEVLQIFLKSKIVRFTEEEQFYEITHDSLAQQIHDKRDNEEIAILEVQRLIKGQMALQPDDRGYFTVKQLEVIELYLDKLKLNKEERLYLQACRKEIDRVNRLKRRRLRLTFIAIAIALSAMASLTWWAITEQQKTQEAIETIQRNQKIRAAQELKSYADSYFDLRKMEEAATTYQAALDSLAEYPNIKLYEDILNKIEETK